MDGDHRKVTGDKRTDAEYTADVLAEAIEKGLGRLADSIGGGLNPENVAMSLHQIAESLNRIAESLDRQD